ncbi:MAG: cadherin-like domain-containing protein, partial [Gemmataceae bacterium]
LTVTVQPVNDDPAFTAGGPAAVDEDAGPQSLDGWATALAGPPDESGQSLTYEVEVLTHPALFSAGPVVSASGTLTYTPAAHANGNASFRVRVHDGVDASPWQTFTLTVNPINDAPVVPGSPAYLPAIPRRAANPAGVAVSTLLAGTSEFDGDALGVAVTAATGVGTWQYRLAGGPWLPFRTVTEAAARLLRGTDLVRFVPGRAFNGVGSLAFRAWDLTAGSAGDVVSLTAPGAVGGLTAFSGTTRTGVELVNTAPILNAAPRSFGLIYEDRALKPQRVRTLLTNRVRDTDPAALRGIAVRGATGPGTWQYSLDGRTWTAFGPVSDTAARLLRDTDLLRFLPSANASGAATLSYRAWDRKLGTVGGLLDLQASGVGGSWTVSGAAATVSLVVRAVNDAPVLPTTAVTLPGVPRSATDPAGVAVTMMLVGVTDIDTAALSGAAIIGTSGGGRWQFSLNGGGTWLGLTATAARARLLRDTDLVRFVPDGTFTGNATLTLRAWDRAAGVAGRVVNLTRATAVGGITPYSLNTRAALIPVTE